MYCSQILNTNYKLMKKLNFSLLSLLSIFLLSVVFVGCDNKKINPLLKQAADGLNKNCPMEVDYMTTLISCEALPSMTLKYTYRLNADFTTMDTADLKKSIRDNTLYMVINNSDIKPLKLLNVNFLHVYNNSNDELIFENLIVANDYKNPSSTGRESKKTLSDEETYKELQGIVNLQKGQLPQKIHEDIAMIDIKCAHPRTLEYVYSFVNIDLDKDENPLKADELKANLIQGVKAEKKDMLLKDNNVIFVFTYQDKNGKQMVSVTLTSADYK